MSILSETVTIKWNTKTKKHYEELGYAYTGINTELTVKVEHLTKGSPVKVRVKCDSCGKEYEIEYRKIMRNYSEHSNKIYCKQCSIKLFTAGKNKKTHNDFVKEVNDKYPNYEYTVLSKYKDNKTKISIRHNKCLDGTTYEWNVIPNAFLYYENMCPHCKSIKTSIRLNKGKNDFIKELYKIHKDEYTVLGEYENIDTNILIRHNICGHEWEVIPYNILHGSGCPQCAIEKRAIKKTKTQEQFELEVRKVFKDEYTVTGIYTKSRNKVKVRHNICGNEYYVMANHLIRGSGCPICNESKGEQFIRHHLENNNFFFSSQYEFNDLIGVGGGILRFDFAIFENKEKTKLKYLIEFDGIQHFEPTDFKSEGKESAEKYFKIQQNNDLLKDEYCILHSIKLIRIPYWEFENLENILNNAINLQVV